MLKGDPKLQFLQNLAYFEDVSKFIIIRKASSIKTQIVWKQNYSLV